MLYVRGFQLGVNLRIAIKRKSIFIIYYLFPVILKYKAFLKIKWVFVILLNLFVVRNFRGTCSSSEKLKVYMIRERLGTPALCYGMGSSSAIP